MSDETEATESEEAGASSDEPQGPSVVLLDPFVDPDLLRTLESELGHSIRIADPLPLDPDLPGPGDLAIVIPLDLGAVSGLDLVESLRARADSDGVPIAVTSAEPTRRRVRAAMRAGATTWLHQPYDPLDWKQRLGPRLESAEAGPPASPAAEEEEASA